MTIHDWSRVDDGIFHDLHLNWIAGLRTVLNDGILPPPYYALAEPVAGGAVPDVLAIEAAPGEPAGEPVGAGLLLEDQTNRAVAVAPSEVLVQDLDRTREYSQLRRRVLIKDELRGHRVVAAIETVSPGNKDGPSRRQEFVDKLGAFFDNGIHVLVLDVAPPTPAVPCGFHDSICEAHRTRAGSLPSGRPLQAGSYEVLEDLAVRGHVVPLRVGDSLPEMPLFLLPHRFVRVPLEATYAHAFQGLARPFRRQLEA